jgi:glycerophosphoryl diester phosphodiesterase
VSALRLAHRGDWRHGPENSLAAMRAALLVPGCDGLELDVRASSDGVPILLHDPSLRRVTGVAAPPSSLTARELAGLGVATLAEVLVAAGAEPFLDIEIKEVVPGALELLDAARGITGDSGAGPLHHAVVSSFHTEVLEWLAESRSGWVRWLNVEHDLGPRTFDAARRLGCTAISAEWRLVDRRVMDAARSAGLSIAAWTVRRRDTYRRLERLGVAAICVEAAALDG